MIYLISFSVVITALLSWFLTQHNELLSKLSRVVLLVGALVHGLSIYAADISASAQFTILYQDLIILGIVGLLGTILSRLNLLNTTLVFIISAALTLFLIPRLSTALYTVSTPTGSSRLAVNAELLVELEDVQAASSGQLHDWLQSKGCTIQPAFTPQSVHITSLDNYFTVDVPPMSAEQLEALKTKLSTFGGLIALEENERILLDEFTATPLKHRANYKVNDPGVELSWGFSPMKMDKWYDFMQQNKLRPFQKARLAILDTGIDAQHEDIADKYVSTNKKYDNDPKGHGTHCAGIAAAVSDNNVGIASYALTNEFVSVTSIKVLNAYGMGTQQTIINGIIEAADTGADVISMSLGGRSSDKKQRAYAKAVKYANKKGAIVVVAAGNSNRNANEYAPANAPGVITVTAIDDQLQRAVFSNYINDIPMGIAAPGVNIYSLIPDNKYATFNGTSMATPYVSGLIAMLKSMRPDLTTTQAYELLHQTGIETKNTTETGRLIQPLEAWQQVLD